MKVKTILIVTMTFVICFFAKGKALACSLKPTSSWYFSDEKLIDSTENIFEGRVIAKEWTWSMPWSPSKYKYTIEVIRNLKGNLPKEVTMTLASSSPTKKSGDAGYGPDCSLFVSLEKGQKYLIFMDAFHPLGYKRIEESTDAWVSAVDKQLNIKEKK